MENTHAQIEGYANCLQELIKELEERIERERKEKQRGWGLIVAEFEAYKKTLETKLSKLQILY